MSIVSTLDRAADPAFVEGIARRLGVDLAPARAGIEAILPVILAMLSGKGSTAAGAGEIFDAVRGGNARHDLAALFGKDETAPLLRAVDRFGGIGAERSARLLDTLGPMVFGVLAGEIEQRHLDKSGLARFLRDQREAIAEALPDGFVLHLSGSRHFDTFRTGFASDESAPMTVTALDDPVVLARADYAETVRRPVAMGAGIAGVLVLLAGAWLFYATGAHREALSSEATETDRRPPFDHGAYSD